MQDWHNIHYVIYSIGLLMPRLMAAFSFSGFMSRSMIPSLIRNMIAINLSIFMYPVIMNKIIDLTWSWSLFLLIMAKEVFLGTFMGLLTGMIFWAVESAGFFIDNQRGGAIASAINPLSGVNTTPLGMFFMHIVVTYFFISGIFVIFLRMVFESYILWPVWQLLPSLHSSKIIPLLTIIDKFLLQVFLVAAPMILAMFLSELGLGLINRFAPQLQVFFISMSVKSLILFVILIFYFTFMISLFHDMLLEINIIPKSLIFYLGS